MRMEHVQDPAAVRLDGAAADGQRLGNGVVRQPADDQLEDFLLAPGERRERRRIRSAVPVIAYVIAEGEMGDRGRQIWPAARDGADGAEQLRGPLLLARPAERA